MKLILQIISHLFLVATLLAQVVPQPFENKAYELRFEEINGQLSDTEGNVRSDILFLLKDKGMNVYFTKNGIYYQWHYTEELLEGTFRISEATGKPITKESKPFNRIDDLVERPATFIHRYRVDMQWNNSNPEVELIAEGAFNDHKNYYTAKNSESITGVKSYATLTYRNLYPGIDVVYHIKEGHLKYDVHVHAGADLNLLSYSYSGALPALTNGKLRIETPYGFLEEQQPVSWDETGKSISVNYQKHGKHIGFTTDVSSEKGFVIDPSLIWATYYGGSSDDFTKAIKTDASGNVYVYGQSASTNNIASGGHLNTGGGAADVFLVKFNTAGVRQWATYFRRSEYSDSPGNLAIDGSGNIYLAGSFERTVFPSQFDAFLVKFNSSGGFQWSVDYGGSGNDYGSSVSTDATGNIYLAGTTNSTTGISSSGHQNTFGGGTFDSFLAKFNPQGVRLWATYYGGTGSDSGRDVTTDGSGNVYLAGTTQSFSAIAIGGHQNSNSGAGDAYLVKFNTNGERQWATYYGGTSYDEGSSVGTDEAGNVFLAGSTASTTNISNNSHQNTFGGGGEDPSDAFLAKFNTNGTRLWATYYGGSGDDYANAIATDSEGNIYMAGTTQSTSAIASGGHKNTYGGGISDAFLVKFNTSGARQWGTYYGGTSDDTGYAVATDNSGNVYLGGLTMSTGNISSSGHQNTFGGGNWDGFLVKFQGAAPVVEPTAQPTGLNFTSVTTSSFTVNYTAATGSPAGYIAVRREGAAPTSDPVDGTVYTINASLGNGTVVFVGSATTFNQIGLNPATTYHYKIYSFNGSGSAINYRQTAPLSGSQATAEGLANEPGAQPTALNFTAVTASSFTINYTIAAGSPTGYIAVRREGAAPTTDPVDGTAYTVNSALGNGVVVFVGNANTFNQSGLNASTTYYYKIYSFNGNGNSTNYLQASPLNGSQTTAAKQDQTISFAPLPDKTVGDPAFTLTATATSTLPVSFATTSNFITISGNTVSIQGAGRATISASQSGNEEFFPASSVNQSFCVRPAKPIINKNGNDLPELILTSSSVTGNQWYFNGNPITGATNQSLTVTDPGSYTVQAKVDDCISEFSNAVLIVITSTEGSSAQGITVYPNPFDDVLSINLHESLLNADIELIDEFGRILRAMRASQQVLKISTENIKPGLLLLRITSHNAVYVHKIIKK
ncbi:MAG TPA: SBBP repeat-containing protein [Cyclobacteriaceae bacterium]|nr:SBBP repeat-containing protein [Cyclobacteriaceae bacterium]HRJ83764.1 SBBP repeat-containing protein [Cyclobacteriaceae bacterium]